ncbi:right-handed parallel beta-helix repeat-containing protein [Bradyrhizobium sp. AZCC 2230]|uniref:right-handed parallel beta-helix repeat-containing protein n=1 Tax=Bradyrhizobium sp. AZCC 2230 TaxID=3117021 RepID=UPI002FEFB42D
MRRIALLAVLLGLFASAPAHAQASRTWVSGVGDDANPCSRTAPCKTFAGAISKTAAFGEINCLDPGGFGAVTITKSMTLNCSATLGSVLVAGTNGIVISAAATDKVILRNIQIQGLAGTAAPGLNGVRILTAASVSIENCVITQFSQAGISDARTAGNTLLFVRNTIISYNTGNAISLTATAANKAIIEDSSLINSVGSGIGVGNLNNAFVTRTVIAGNAASGIVNDGGSAINVDSSSITGNGTGITANGIIRLSNSDVTLNATGFAGSATVSYGNNRLAGNTTFGVAVTPAGGASSNLGEQ